MGFEVSLKVEVTLAINEVIQVRPYFDMGPIFAGVVYIGQSSDLNCIDHSVLVLFKGTDDIVDGD